jgi:hypothetical protein
MDSPAPRATRLLGAAAAAGLALAVLALTECAHPGPINFGPRGRLKKPEPLFEAVLAQRDHATSVSGAGKALIETKDGTTKLNELIVAKAPSNLRLETTSFFGNPVAVLTADGTAFALFDMEHHQFFEGPATPANVSRLLPIHLRPEDITSLLLGVPPMLSALTSLQIDVDEERRCYTLTIHHWNKDTHEDETEVVGMDPLTLRPLWVRMNAAAAITPFEATFGNYDNIQGLPRDIKLTTAEPKTRIEVHWNDRDLNPRLTPDQFTQAPPPGLTPTNVE